MNKRTPVTRSILGTTHTLWCGRMNAGPHWSPVWAAAIWEKPFEGSPIWTGDEVFPVEGRATEVAKAQAVRILQARDDKMTEAQRAARDAASDEWFAAWSRGEV